MNPFIVAGALGLKHSLDPDHIAAVFNMTLSGKARPGEAAKLGFSWGLGHSVTMLALGLPVVLFGTGLPEWVYSSAELAIGVIILYLTLKLFIQWFKGEFHPHEIIKLADSQVDHMKHHKRAGAMGVLHGIGGSAGGAALALTAFSTPLTAAFGLLIFVLFSIASMTTVTFAFSYAATRHTLIHVLDRLLIPVFIIAAGLFGVNYIQEALKALGL